MPSSQWRTRSLPLRTWLIPGSAWLLTRALGIAALVGAVPYGNHFARLNGDVRLYEHWSRLLLHGALPYRDFPLQYPPGVLPFLALPHGSANGYVVEFVTLAVVADLACLLLLARGGRHRWGVTFWIVALPLLGPIAWGRFDIFVALALVGALVALESGRPMAAGLCVGYAGLMKLWPLGLLVVLLPLLSRREAKRFAVAGAGMAFAVVVPLLAAGAGGGLRWCLNFESGRGVEIESLPAVPLHAAQAFGVPWHLDTSHLSLDLAISGARLVGTLSTALLAAAWLAVAMWVLRDRGRHTQVPVVVLALCILTIATSKVLSPQYLLWPAAVAAFTIDGTRDPQRLGIWLGLTLTTTQMLFPFLFATLAAGTVIGLVAAALHGVAIIAVAVVAIREGIGVASSAGAPPRTRPAAAAAVPAG